MSITPSISEAKVILGFCKIGDWINGVGLRSELLEGWHGQADGEGKIVVACH